MRGPEIQEITMHVGEVHRLTESSEKLVDEILDLLAEIDAPEDEARCLWLTAPRGTFQEYKKGYHIYDDITTKKQFVKEYPDEIMWFPIIGIRCEDTKYLRINNLTVNIDTRERSVCREFDCDFDDLFLWAKYAVIGALSELRKGDYNDFVKNELPYTLRNGTIKRSLYWEVHPNDVPRWLEDLTEEEIKDYINTAPKYRSVPNHVIKCMTFHQYMDMAIACYKRIGYEIYDDYKKSFFSHAEDFGGGVLEWHVDYDSVQNFDDFFDGKCGNGGGHPWGLIRGSSRTRISLYPARKDGGYYFRLSGNPNWNVRDLVRCFLALRDLGVPFLTYPNETISYLKREDLIGIVSKEHFPIYCQMLFPDLEVNDFRHLDLEEDKVLMDKIEWLPIEEVKLKQ